MATPPPPLRQLDAAAKEAGEARQAMARVDEKLQSIRTRRREVQVRRRAIANSEMETKQKEREVAELERRMRDEDATQRVLEKAARTRVTCIYAFIQHLAELEDATRASDGARIKQEKAEREHSDAVRNRRQHEMQLACVARGADASRGGAGRFVEVQRPASDARLSPSLCSLPRAGPATGRRQKQREVAELDRGVKDAKKEHASVRWRACRTSPLWYCGNAPEGRGQAHPGECFCGPNSGAVEARRAYYIKDATGSKGQCQALRMDPSANEVMDIFQRYDLNEEGVYQRMLEDLDVKKREIGDRLANTTGNPALRSTLEQKERELEDKRRTHAQKLQESAEFQEETTRESQQFNRTVKAVVQSIDAEFRRVFASVGERGTVELDTADGVRSSPPALAHAAG